MTLRLPLVVSTLALAAPALAQWPTNPTQSLAVGDGASDQNLAKLAATTDGGTWLSWFDGIASGWDVRLQRLEADGTERFAHGGVLVADRSFSSTQDYGLALDSNGDALLAFRDPRPGFTAVTAAKVTGLGAQPWGASGVVLSASGPFVASPKIAGVANGGAVVAWTEDSAVRLQRLDANGATQWATPVTLTPAAGTYSVADLRAVGDDVILSFVHQTGGFTSPRHLFAARFDASGAQVWAGGPRAVLDSGSLQLGNFPTFSVDAGGGSLFWWYTSSPALQSWVQRLDAAGNELFPHNGVAVATTPARVRVAPDAAFDATTGSVYVAWRDQSATQSQQGVAAQRIDATGARLWTDDGVVLVPLGAGEQDLVRAVVGGGGGVLVVWSSASGFGTDVLGATRLSSTGTVLVPRFDVASTPSEKMRLATAASGTSADVALLAWTDTRFDAGDVLAQSIGFDGTVGAVPGLGANYFCPANTNSTGQSAHISATGSASVAANQLSLHVTGLPLQSSAYFLTSLVGGFIVLPGGSQGNLCLGGAIGRNVGGVIQNSGATGIVTAMGDLTQMPQPSGPVAVQAGETWHFQCWYRDAVGGTATSNFTDALRVTFQ